MGYDKDFYELYNEYLQEHRVRVKHDAMFRIWSMHIGMEPIVPIDLGCGRGLEYLEFGPSTPVYMGFDVNAIPRHEENGSDKIIVKDWDYRAPNFVAKIEGLQESNHPNAFVSLFSTEPTAPAEENTKLYERLFEQIPTLTHALVTGFCYTDKKGQEKVEEAGGLISYQTFGDPAPTDTYEDLRIVTPVPSTLFGENVVEVWRILTRKNVDYGTL